MDSSSRTSCRSKPVVMMEIRSRGRISSAGADQIADLDRVQP